MICALVDLHTSGFPDRWPLPLRTVPADAASPRSRQRFDIPTVLPRLDIFATPSSPMILLSGVSIGCGSEKSLPLTPPLSRRIAHSIFGNFTRARVLTWSSHGTSRRRH